MCGSSGTERELRAFLPPALRAQKGTRPFKDGHLWMPFTFRERKTWQRTYSWAQLPSEAHTKRLLSEDP